MQQGNDKVQAKLLLSKGADKLLNLAATKSGFSRSIIVQTLIEQYLVDRVLTVKIGQEQGAGHERDDNRR